MKTIKELADLIEANPNCEFIIDNDSWDVVDPENIDDDDKYTLASSLDYDERKVQWYGPHYGGTLAAALVEILNRKGFNIKAGAC